MCRKKEKKSRGLRVGQKWLKLRNSHLCPSPAPTAGPPAHEGVSGSKGELKYTGPPTRLWVQELVAKQGKTRPSSTWPHVTH